MAASKPELVRYRSYCRVARAPLATPKPVPGREDQPAVQTGVEGRSRRSDVKLRVPQVARLVKTPVC